MPTHVAAVPPPGRRAAPPPRGSYRVGLREPAFPGGGAGRAYVWGDRFRAWPKPLHDGTAFGLAGRLFVFAVGGMPPAMLLTGMLIRCFKRRAARRR